MREEKLLRGVVHAAKAATRGMQLGTAAANFKVGLNEKPPNLSVQSRHLEEARRLTWGWADW